MTTELHRLTALDAGAKIAAGVISSEELVRSCLEFIDKRENEIGARHCL